MSIEYIHVLRHQAKAFPRIFSGTVQSCSVQEDPRIESKMRQLLVEGTWWVGRRGPCGPKLQVENWRQRGPSAIQLEATVTDELEAKGRPYAYAYPNLLAFVPLNPHQGCPRNFAARRYDSRQCPQFVFGRSYSNQIARLPQYRHSSQRHGIQVHHARHHEAILFHCHGGVEFVVVNAVRTDCLMSCQVASPG